MANPFNLVSAMIEINEHVRVWNRVDSHVSRDDVHYHGLGGSIVMRCNKRQHCKHWPDGTFRMHTQTPISTQEYGKSQNIDAEILDKWKNFMPKEEYRANMIHTIGESMTSIMPAEFDSIFAHIVNAGTCGF